MSAAYGTRALATYHNLPRYNVAFAFEFDDSLGGATGEARLTVHRWAALSA